MRMNFPKWSLALALLTVLSGAHAEAPADASLADKAAAVVEKVRNATEHGLKVAAKGVEHGAKSAANGVEHGAKATARGIEHGAEATERAVDHAAHKVTGSSTDQK